MGLTCGMCSGREEAIRAGVGMCPVLGPGDMFCKFSFMSTSCNIFVCTCVFLHVNVASGTDDLSLCMH